VQRQLEFALEHSHAYEVLFDGVARPPSLHEGWPSFNLMRDRLAQRLGGTPREHTRLMLAIWSLTHGAAMLIIRGGFEDALRTQCVHACLDAFDAIIESVARSKGLANSGSKWPANLILGEGKQSRVGDAHRNGGGKGSRTSHAKKRHR
jgi:hypothetical protein